MEQELWEVRQAILAAGDLLSKLVENLVRTFEKSIFIVGLMEFILCGVADMEVAKEEEYFYKLRQVLNEISRNFHILNTFQTFRNN